MKLKPVWRYISSSDWFKIVILATPEKGPRINVTLVIEVNILGLLYKTLLIQGLAFIAWTKKITTILSLIMCRPN